MVDSYFKVGFSSTDYHLHFLAALCARNRTQKSKIKLGGQYELFNCQSLDLLIFGISSMLELILFFVEFLRMGANSIELTVHNCQTEIYGSSYRDRTIVYDVYFNVMTVRYTRCCLSMEPFSIFRKFRNSL